MQATLNHVNRYIDDLFYRSLSEISLSIKDGLNFNSIFNQINSHSGSLIDYNIRVLAYNCTTVLAIMEVAAFAIFGMNVLTITGNLLISGILLLIRYQMKKDLENFWYQKVANMALEPQLNFVIKTSKLYNIVIIPDISKKIQFVAGKDFGPLGLFKTVTPVEEIFAKIKLEANIQDNQNESFNTHMKNLPPNSTLFLTLLRINAYLQGNISINPPKNVKRLDPIPKK